MKEKLIYVLFSLIFLFASCGPKDIELPYLGRAKFVDGKEVKHRIRSFEYIDQDSLPFNSETLKGQVYLADFFFTSCPSICPRVMKNMLRVQEKFKGAPNFKLVSFSLDPKRDTPARLKKYAVNIGADLSMWHFVHGPKDSIMTIANEDYYVPAFEDAYYDAYCGNCHMENGEGLSKLIPSLHNSAYLKNNQEELPCIIRNGILSKVADDSDEVQLSMPAHPQLNDKLTWLR